MPQERPQLVSKLRNRELYNAPPGALINHSRRIYSCIPPVQTATDVEGLEDHLGQFVGDGEHLVCFGYSLHDVALYRYTGLQECTHGDADEGPSIAHNLPFSRFFKLAYRQVVSQGNELLKKDFCLVAHNNRFLILASSVPAATATDAGLLPSIPNVPLHQLVTFHVMELSTGVILDRYTIANDCIDLTSNNGAYLYDDLLAVLAIHTQEVHLLQLLPSGRFLVLHHLGKRCWDDDDMVISEQVDAEARWRRTQGFAAEEGPVAAPSLAPLTSEIIQPMAPPPAALQRAATEEELAELPAADELQQGAIAVLPILPEPGRPIILPLFPQAGLIRGDSGVLPPLEASVLENQLIIEGIRHRILAHLFRQRSAEGPSSGALRRLFFHFQEYASIIIWKVQFLDRRRLLLSAGLPNASRSRSGDSYFLVVYDWHSGQVLNFMDSQSEDMLMLYLQLTPCFYGGSVISSWARHVTPCPPALRCPRDQGSLRSWASSQAARRILGSLPTSSQGVCLSPYLDARLFAYDEKLIAPDMRPRTYSEQALKFVSQAHPNACRFKVQPIASQNTVQAAGRHLKQLVAYSFHPVEPLVICLLHTPMQPPQLTLYYRR